MFNYKIANSKELHEFLKLAKHCGHDCFAVKGNPPKDAVYSDGDKVARPINVAWVNDFTGERLDIKYSKLAGDEQLQGDTND